MPAEMLAFLLVLNQVVGSLFWRVNVKTQILIWQWCKKIFLI